MRACVRARARARVCVCVLLSFSKFHFSCCRAVVSVFKAARISANVTSPPHTATPPVLEAKGLQTLPQSNPRILRHAVSDT